MNNKNEQFTIPFGEHQEAKEEKIADIDESDLDQEIEDYEENLEAQHADADKVFETQKLEKMLKQKEQDDFEERLQNSREDHEETVKMNQRF